MTQNTPIEKSQIVDLHCHSHYSDGSLSPEELLDWAKNLKIEILAISDHDTIEGVQSLRKMREELSLNVIPAVEISTKWQQLEIHIVGLNIDPNNEELIQFLETQSQLRSERANQLIEKIEHHLNVSETRLKLNQVVKGKIICRSHIAQLLVNEGLAVDSRRAFEKFLRKGKILEVKSFWPEMEQVINVIHKAGGVAVLAHPSRYKTGNSRLTKLIVSFKQAGGEGMELSYPGLQPHQQRRLIRLARENELLASQGSDFHHPYQKWANIHQVIPIPADIPRVWTDFSHRSLLSN